MRTLRLPVGALLVALALSAVLAVGASATPVAKTTVECDDGSATLVLMHPGVGGKAIWDISVESLDAPSYLIKSVEGTVFDPDGVQVGTLSKSVGEKIGLGEPLECEFEVHWDDGFSVHATLQLVRL